MSSKREQKIQSNQSHAQRITEVVRLVIRENVSMADQAVERIRNCANRATHLKLVKVSR